MTPTTLQGTERHGLRKRTQRRKSQRESDFVWDFPSFSYLASLLLFHRKPRESRAFLISKGLFSQQHGYTTYYLFFIETSLSFAVGILLLRCKPAILVKWFWKQIHMLKAAVLRGQTVPEALAPGRTKVKLVKRQLSSAVAIYRDFAKLSHVAFSS